MPSTRSNGDSLELALDAATPTPPLDGVSAEGIAVSAQGSTKVCVGIATRGRPDSVEAVVGALKRQSVPPEQIIVSCVEVADAGAVAGLPDVLVLCGPPGLARQRNAVLDAVSHEIGVIAFFDDDFIPHPDWLRVALDHFDASPDVVCLTGNVLADGIKGPGLRLSDAERELEIVTEALPDYVIEGFSPYGCNMAFRRAAIGELRFDERLVLYGWLEDRDFGAALAKRGGKMVKLGKAAGVHLGTKRGRVSGVRLGYSQVVNPVFMLRKGTISPGKLMNHITSNLLSNLAGAVAPEPFIDRRGRLRGNLVGFCDLLRGRVTPERAERL